MRNNIWNSNVAKYIDEHRTNIISEVGQQHFPCPLLNHYFCYSSCSMLFIRIFVFFQIVYLIYLYNRRDFIYLSWKELFFAKIYLLTFLAHCEEKMCYCKLSDVCPFVYLFVPKSVPSLTLKLFTRWKCHLGGIDKEGV